MNQAELFDKKYKEASTWQKERFEKLMNKYKNIKFDDKQKRYLLWLSQWDQETIETFESIFETFEE